MNKQPKKPLPEIGYVKPKEIVREMEESYTDYAMSVIVSRALPDVRDGLKPVHRRILYSLNEMGLTHLAKFRKSATVVGECFVKDTLILTTRGLVPIEKVNLGDTVYTQKGLGRVTRLYEMPEKPLLQVVLENGNYNITTPSQKFKVLTPDWKFEWKEAKDLTENDYLIVRADYPEINGLVKLKRTTGNQPQYLNKDIAYFLGIFIADGFISNDYGKKKAPRIQFGLGDEKGIAQKIVSILKQEFAYTPTIENRFYQYCDKSGKIFNNKGYTVRMNRQAINEFFVANFDIRGVKAPTKKIPFQIFQSPPEVIFSFISGLVDGDGHIYDKKSRIQYCSISKNLMNELLILLQQQEIFSSKYAQKLYPGGMINGRQVRGRHRSYSLEVRGVNAVKLATRLTLFSKQKNFKLKNIIKNQYPRNDYRFQYDAIPYAGKMIFKELQEKHLGAGWYSDTDGEKFRMGIKYQTGCKIRYSGDLWEKPLRKTQVVNWGIEKKLNKIGSPIFEFLHHLVKNKIYFFKISSIKRVAPEKTYDLGVENDHEFIANGMAVHNCMGKYHPHGDLAIYDALVRMAQGFSLRYPLVEGQGNFGCFTKDTKVRLTDGRSLSFEELIAEEKQGKKNYTFTFNSQTKKIEITEVKNPRLTRKNERIIEVTLDNGEKIKCTLNHQFMLRGGVYKEAKDLRQGDSLMPLYTKFYDGKNNRNLKGYEMLYQSVINGWEFVHHLADQWNLNKGAYKKNAGRIRHHLDFNKLNNNPDNISRIQWQSHWARHQEITSARHKNDPEYVKKIAAGRKIFWSNKNNRISYSRRRAERNRVMWRDPKYRELWIEARRKMWLAPGYREMMAKKASKNLRRMWKRKEFQELMSKIKSQELKKRWQDENYRKIMAEQTKELSLKIWSDSRHREYISKLMKEKAKSPIWQERQREIAKKLWQNPAYRAKYSPAHFRQIGKKAWQNPEVRARLIEKARKQWRDPEFRQRMIEGVRFRNLQRTNETPDFMRELTEKAKISLKRNWGNPLYKKKVIKSRILSYVYSLLNKYPKVTPAIYNKERYSNCIPRMGKALTYFSSFSEILSESRNHNHKVVKIRALKRRENVYDLTTEPWHNFSLAAGVFVHNSVDGDPPSAMRYSEVRFSKIGEEMLKDIDKGTVDFVDNYDNTRKEPAVLPSPLPQVLLNGSLGIAVGMATNIPPHNLSEVVDAAIYLVDNPRATTVDLFRFIKGPDFPTGGIIYDQKAIIEAYSQGKGSILMRGKAEIIEEKTGRQQIIISEIPFQVQKSSLVEQFANLVQEKKIDGIKDIRDESNKEGMRIIIELTKDAYPNKILNRLYKFSNLQRPFHLNMLALIDGIQPRVLPLNDLLNYFISHRQQVVWRRTKFDLLRAKERVHILQGLNICLTNIDAVIKTIKASANRQEAKKNLIKRFKLTEIQANAILEIKLQQLAKLERQKIEDELKEKLKAIKELTIILKSPQKIKDITKKELTELKAAFGDLRKTRVVVHKVGEIAEEDLVPDEETIITLTRDGYIKRINPLVYKIQKRGGKGILGMKTLQDDIVEHFLSCRTHDSLLFLTDSGKVFKTPVYEIPEGNRVARGRGLLNFLEISAQEKVLSIFPLGKKDEEEGIKYLVMATKDGIIKKTRLEEFNNVRRSGLIAITLKKDDQLKKVCKSTGEDEIILVTRQGQSIRFQEKEVREMGRQAAGIRGIRLKKGDEVKGMDVLNPKSKIQSPKLLVVMENGYGKRTDIKEYRPQGRGGSGIKTAQINPKTGDLVGSRLLLGDEEDLIVISQKGQVIRTKIASIPILGRATQGVRIMRLDEGDKVASATCI